MPRRLLLSCIARASTVLPVPLSPSSKTVQFVSLHFSRSRSILRTLSLNPQSLKLLKHAELSRISVSTPERAAYFLESSIRSFSASAVSINLYIAVFPPSESKLCFSITMFAPYSLTCTDGSVSAPLSILSRFFSASEVFIETTESSFLLLSFCMSEKPENLPFSSIPGIFSPAECVKYITPPARMIIAASRCSSSSLKLKLCESALTETLPFPAVSSTLVLSKIVLKQAEFRSFPERTLTPAMTGSTSALFSAAIITVNEVFSAFGLTMRAEHVRLIRSGSPDT